LLTQISGCLQKRPSWDLKPKHTSPSVPFAAAAVEASAAEAYASTCYRARRRRRLLKLFCCQDMSWTIGTVSRKALIRKWIAGPDSAAIAPLVAAVALGCTVRGLVAVAVCSDVR
jgi:hypothetical protein